MVKLRCRTILLIAIGLSWFSGAMADLNDGLVAYYPFDGNANDESGNGNDGTVHEATLTTDRVGNANSAYSFDGFNDYISANPINILKSNTITAWVNVTALDDDPDNVIIENSDLSGIADYGIYALHLPDEPGNYNVYYFLRDINGNGYYIKSGIYLSVGSWHFISAVYDGNTALLSIDGQVVVSSPLNINLRQNAVVFGIADDYVGAGHSDANFNGAIDEIRIYNRALSDSEIQQLYQMNNQPSDNCWAIYENGNLHIPCIKVKGPFDDELHYEADMQYEPLSDPMSFQVTGAKPK
ncbi:hypothetical protein PN36_23840 [Candidatus Thiomargarita nelsonii]|uniref:LamG-like jellyroll fold domain-containing protein n=1 Tax=Candidatus Thiomargarita nelsonii TaxID=1003181 RepID=A0A4E0QTF7_9GAMM|nr:hypothetical protein PN36_23840 [Candidatus Thiomargarita nelsonii]